MTSDALFVVPTERHVERLAREGARAETRASLRARLVAALLPDVRFAEPAETLIALAVALEDVATGDGGVAAEPDRPSIGQQLGLFAVASPKPSPKLARRADLHTLPGVAAVSEGEAPRALRDPVLAALRARGGASWVRAVRALDDALGVLRARGASIVQVERARADGPVGARLRMFSVVLRALDGRLARAGARDGRLVGPMLARAIQAAPAASVAAAVGASRVHARWSIAWEPSDLAWWRALDEALGGLGGHARVILPGFDKRLEGGRESDPLEVVADAVAQRLDAAPEIELIAPILGDLASTPPRAEDVMGRVDLRRVGSARAEADVVAGIVHEALARGARVERIAIAYPARDERTLDPLRRALDRFGVVYYDALGAAPSSAPIVAAALHALGAASSLERDDVARLLRSGYIDAPRVLADPSGAERLDFPTADRVLRDLARSLETRATVQGLDPLERLVKTAAARDPLNEGHARRVFDVLARARAATTRVGRAQAARRLWDDLGFGARAGLGARASFSRDAAPVGVERAERAALARDVRAWQAALSALDLYETTTLRTGGGEQPTDADAFRMELTQLLEVGARTPAGGRVGAVRITHLADVVGDELDLLIVLDANDGLLPREVAPNPLVSEGIESALVRSSDEGFAPTRHGESAARDLTALAAGAAEAGRLVLVTTRDDESSSHPSRVFLSLEAVGVPVASNASGSRPDSGALHAAEDAPAPATTREVDRRIARERLREGFFLDPMRAESEIVGRLAASTEPDARRDVIAYETGGSLERALAVTSLERFAQCAFKGYAEVVLGAREAEEQQELPDAREEGNLAHAALAAAFVAASDEWPKRPRDRDAIIARALPAADRTLEEAGAHAPLRALVRLRLRETVLSMLARAIDDEAWDFALAEQPFGRKSGWPALHVHDGRTHVWLRGSIDRVDRAHGRAAERVIDYKRSKSKADESMSELGKTALQVPIYALVAAHRSKSEATGRYVPILARSAPFITKAAVRGEEVVSELARARGDGLSAIEQRVIAVTADAREGLFAPIPASERECSFCPVSGGCRKPRFAMASAEDLEDKDAP